MIKNLNDKAHDDDEVAIHLNHSGGRIFYFFLTKTTTTDCFLSSRACIVQSLALTDPPPPSSFRSTSMWLCREPISIVNSWRVQHLVCYAGGGRVYLLFPLPFSALAGNSNWIELVKRNLIMISEFFFFWHNWDHICIYVYMYLAVLIYHDI